MNMQKMHRVLMGLSVFFATIGSARAAPFRTYAIGNSLTVNATLNAMDDMAAQAGISSFSSDHIYLGQSLNTIWTNPTHTDSPYGTEQGATDGRTRPGIFRRHSRLQQRHGTPSPWSRSSRR